MMYRRLGLVLVLSFCLCVPSLVHAASFAVPPVLQQTVASVSQSLGQWGLTVFCWVHPDSSSCEPPVAAPTVGAVPSPAVAATTSYPKQSASPITYTASPAIVQHIVVSPQPAYSGLTRDQVIALIKQYGTSSTHAGTTTIVQQFYSGGEIEFHDSPSQADLAGLNGGMTTLQSQVLALQAASSSDLTLTSSLNASNITSGTLALARLASSTNGTVLMMQAGVPAWVATSTLGIAPDDPSQWTASGSDIYYNTGNVGIGTDDPQALLDVRGTGYNDNSPLFNVESEGYADFSLISDTSGNKLSFQADPYGTSVTTDINGIGNSFFITRQAVGGTDYAEFIGGSNNVHFFGDGYFDGNVGIGTTDPQSLLDVAGNANFASFSSDGGNISTDGSGDLSVAGTIKAPALADINGNTIIGASAGDGSWTSSGGALLVDSNGNVNAASFATPYMTLQGGQIYDENGNPIIDASAGDGSWTGGGGFFSVGDVGDIGVNSITIGGPANAFSPYFIDSLGEAKFASVTSDMLLDGAGDQIITASNEDGSWSTGGGNVAFTADGSIGIGTTTPTKGPLVMGSGAYVTAGGVWTNASDRNLKENFTPLDPHAILAKIDALPITQWNYKTESASTTHIGPVAQDFYAAFGLGGSDTSISTIDPAGVALVGIQALSSQVQSIQSLLASTTLGDTNNSPGLLGLLQQVGVTFVQNMTHVASLVTDSLTTRSLTVTQGIQMTDKNTGQVYCVQIASDDWLKTLGDCDSSVTSQLPVTSTDSSDAATSTPQDTVMSDASSTTATSTDAVTDMDSATTSTETATSTDATSSIVFDAADPATTTTP